MTAELPPQREAVLDLMHYENGVATFERYSVPLLSGEGLDGVSIQLGRSSWERMGRPVQVTVIYTVEPR